MISILRAEYRNGRHALRGTLGGVRGSPIPTSILGTQHLCVCSPGLAAVIVLLYYFCISSAILLFGVELNSEVYRKAAEEEGKGKLN